jgi:ribosomal protein L23
MKDSELESNWGYKNSTIQTTLTAKQPKLTFSLSLKAKKTALKKPVKHLLLLF